jgi:hypothetical protein
MLLIVAVLAACPASVHVSTVQAWAGVKMSIAAAALAARDLNTACEKICIKVFPIKVIRKVTAYLGPAVQPHGQSLPLDRILDIELGDRK